MDTVFRVFLATVVGLCVGSFLTVVVDRVPRKESVVSPRSRCPTCATQIRPVDNVPVVSWLLLRGHCRACGARISPMYPLVELSTAALFVGAALTFDDVWLDVLLAPVLGMMPAVALMDWRHKIIPNRLMYPSLVAAPVLIAAAWAAGGGVDVTGAALGLLAYGGGFFIMSLISPRGMGMGDVKLGALIGLVLGAVGFEYVAVAMGVAVLAGGLVSIGALLTGRGRKHAIPFGPFMVLGAVGATFLAPQIADLYLRTVT